MTWIVLLTVVTSAELQTQILNAMTAAGLPTSSWQKKGIWQNLIVWFASMLQLVYAILNDVARGSFLETATDQALIDKGENDYGTKYRGETFANGTITLLNDSGGQIDEPANGLTIAKASDSTITYKNSGVIEGWLNGTELEIPIACEQVGTIGNTPAIAIAPFGLAMVTTIIGVSIVEHSAMVGQDAQDPEAYRELCRKQAQSRTTGGAQGAWEWYPPNLYTDGTEVDPENPDATKTQVNVNRVDVSEESSTGVTTLVVASPSGPVDAGEFATIETFMQQNVKNSGTLLMYNCDDVPVAVVAAIELEKGTPTTGVKAALELYVTDWFGTTDNKIGGGNGLFTQDELKLLIGRGNSKIRKVTLTTINGSPPADIAIAFNESAQAGAMNFTITVQS
jgi:hypothetical protein